MAWKKLKYTDDTIDRKAVLTPAGAISPTTSGAEQTEVTGTNHNYYALKFDAAAKEGAYWDFVIPEDYDGGSITPTIYWTATATTGSVKWDVQTLGRVADEAWDAALGTAETVTTSATGVSALGDVIASSPTGFSPTWTAGDLVVVKVSRDATATGDDYTADASLIMMEIDYTGK